MQSLFYNTGLEERKQEPSKKSSRAGGGFWDQNFDAQQDISLIDDDYRQPSSSGDFASSHHPSSKPSRQPSQQKQDAGIQRLHINFQVPSAAKQSAAKSTNLNSASTYVPTGVQSRRMGAQATPSPSIIQPQTLNQIGQLHHVDSQSNNSFGSSANNINYINVQNPTIVNVHGSFPSAAPSQQQANDLFTGGNPYEQTGRFVDEGPLGRQKRSGRTSQQRSSAQPVGIDPSLRNKIKMTKKIKIKGPQSKTVPHSILNSPLSKQSAGLEELEEIQSIREDFHEGENHLNFQNELNFSKFINEPDEGLAPASSIIVGQNLPTQQKKFDRDAIIKGLSGLNKSQLQDIIKGITSQQDGSSHIGGGQSSFAQSIDFTKESKNVAPGGGTADHPANKGKHLRVKSLGTVNYHHQTNDQGQSRQPSLGVAPGKKGAAGTGGGSINVNLKNLIAQQVQSSQKGELKFEPSFAENFASFYQSKEANNPPIDESTFQQIYGSYNNQKNPMLSFQSLNNQQSFGESRPVSLGMGGGTMQPSSGLGGGGQSIDSKGSKNIPFQQMTQSTIAKTFADTEMKQMNQNWFQMQKQMKIQQKLLKENEKLQKEIERKKSIIHEMSHSSSHHETSKQPPSKPKPKQEANEPSRQPRHQAAQDQLQPPEDGEKRSRSRSKKTIKIIKRKAQSYCVTPQDFEVYPSQQKPNEPPEASGEYEVTTVQYDKNGQKILEKKEKLKEAPVECQDYSNSQKLLKAIKKVEARPYFNDGDSAAFSQMNSKLGGMSNYSQVTDLSKYQKADGAGAITKLLNPKNFKSLKTMDIGMNQSNIYVETGQQRDPSNESKKSRKKITIIMKKRRSDGSIEKHRQEIYQDFGNVYAVADSKRYQSVLDFYKGKIKRPEKIEEEEESPSKAEVIEPKSKGVKPTTVNQRTSNQQLQNNFMSKNLATLKKQTTQLPGETSGANLIDTTHTRKALEKKQTVALSKKGEKADQSASKQDLSFLNGPLPKPGVDGITSRMRTSDDDKVHVGRSSLHARAQQKKEETENPYHDSFDLQPRRNPRSNMPDSSSGSEPGFAPQFHHGQKEDAGQPAKQKKYQEEVLLEQRPQQKPPAPPKPPSKPAQEYALPSAQAQMSAMRDLAMQRKATQGKGQKMSGGKAIKPNIILEDSSENNKGKPGKVIFKNAIAEQASESGSDRAPVNKFIMAKDSNESREVRPGGLRKGQGPYIEVQHSDSNSQESNRQQQQQQQKTGTSEDNQSNVTVSTNFYTFKLPEKNMDTLITFMESLNSNSKKKDAILQPIPPEVGQLQFTIARKKSSFNFMQPSFYLKLETSSSAKSMPILYAKKLVKKSSYYLISLRKNKERVGKEFRDQEVCLGKLRAIEGDKEKYVLYDSGENPQKGGVRADEVRSEHGTFIYKYEQCNVGNIRKMVILFPSILCFRLKKQEEQHGYNHYEQHVANLIKEDQKIIERNKKLNRRLAADESQSVSLSVQEISNVSSSQHYKGLGVKGNRDKYGREIPDSTQYLYKFVEWKPTHPRDSMLSKYMNNQLNKNIMYKIFVDNPPQWNPQSSTYVYDFKGRVTEPSIKNFQLIPEGDGNRGETLSDFVLQFGRKAKDEFILDVQFPLSIFQAFGLALSAFDAI